MLALGILLIASTTVSTVYAGTLNAYEREIVAEATQIFEYNGEQYQVDSGYINQLSNYLATDGIDLNAQQRDEVIQAAFANVQRGVKEGYLVPVKKTDTQTDNPTVGEEPGSGESETTGSANTGTEGTGTVGTGGILGNGTGENESTDSGTESSTGTAGIGTTGIGTTGTGTTGIGTTGTGTTGTGTTGTGTTGIGTTGTGTTGTGTAGTGTAGIGTTGAGTTGIDSTGIDTMGLGFTESGSSIFNTSDYYIYNPTDTQASTADNNINNKSNNIDSITTANANKAELMNRSSIQENTSMHALLTKKGNYFYNAFIIIIGLGILMLIGMAIVIKLDFFAKNEG